MVKIKLEKNKKDEPVFKLNIKEKEIDNYKFLKRSYIGFNNLIKSYHSSFL